MSTFYSKEKLKMKTILKWLHLIFHLNLNSISQHRSRCFSSSVDKLLQKNSTVKI